MLTINKEQLIIFANYMENEIPVSLLEQFIKNKARNPKEEVLTLMGMKPLELV